MTFELQRLSFTFVARDPLRFPDGKAGNTLRGAFGWALRNRYCLQDCGDSERCHRDKECVYRAIFEPGEPAAGPSGLANWPRPFVIQAAELDGCAIEVGSEFAFHVNLFDRQRTAAVSEAFQMLDSSGLGARRSRVALRSCRSEHVVIDLSECPAETREMTVEFLTPTSLKGGTVPTFAAVANRIRDRVSTLWMLYGTAESTKFDRARGLPIDFAAYGQSAAAVEMTRCNIQPVTTERRSGRSGQVHELSGFVGEAEYKGAVAQFIPFFRAATYTGVGSHTSWGQGQIAIRY